MLRYIIWLAAAGLLICGPFVWAQDIKPQVANTPPETGNQGFHPYLPAPGDHRETVQLNRACRNIQNYYECAQAVEKMQLPLYPQLVNRQGGTLRLTLKSGKVAELKDVNIEGQELNSVHYSFREFLQDLGYYLVQEDLYEGGAYLMVNYQNGNRHRLHDLFLLSPDRQRLATVLMCEAHNPNAIQIWRISPEKMTLEWSLDPKDWGPTDGAWQNNDTLTFAKTNYNGVRLEMMLVRKDQTGWRLSAAKP
jgi:hypothetical protein